jgi:YVTN family beta-propeller protein
MRRSLLFLAALALAVLPGCRDTTGPQGGQNPAGDMVVWFNGLSANADAYLPESDSLVQNCWPTGDTPNDIQDLGQGRFAVLSSMGADLRIYDSENAGEIQGSVSFPAGSNPYSMAVSGDMAYVTLLLPSRVAAVDLSSMTIAGQWNVPVNPSGIAVCGGRLFVTHGNWPEPSPGGVTVLDRATGEELAWLDTGVNTAWAWTSPSTGMVHCGATTYADDGSVSIINPATLQVTVTMSTGGTPGEPVEIGGDWISPGGWGGNRLLVYREDGGWNWVETGFAATGLALLENRIYATDFGDNCVRVLDTSTLAPLDTLTAGGEGPQGIVALDR